MHPPKTIKNKESRDFWRHIVNDYELERHHFQLLRLACEALDRSIEACQLVQENGLTVTDNYGRCKEHPAVAIERQSKNNFRLLLRELGLDIIKEEPRLPRQY